MYKIVNCMYTNMRKGPSINHKIITALCSGTIVKLLEWAPSGWGKVEVDGLVGYIPQMHLEPIEEEV